MPVSSSAILESTTHDGLHDAASMNSAAAGQYDVTIHTGREGLTRIQSEWQQAEQFAFCPMQSYAWNIACAQSFPGEITVIAVQSSAVSRGFAAFIQSPQDKKLSCLGHELYEPTVFTYSDVNACAALTRAVLRLKAPIFLRDVYAETGIPEQLQQLCRNRRIHVTRPMPPHPWLHLDESWRDPEQHLNAGRRSDLRRARRLAEKSGIVSCTILSPGPEEFELLLSDILRVEAANWKGKTGGAMASLPGLKAFFRAYGKSAAEKGMLRILTLTIGSKPVAVQFAVEYKGRFWLIKMGYDENFSRCSPGMLLVVESLRYAAARGLKAYEFMGVPEPWNLIWTQMAHPAVSLRIYAPGASGVIGFATEAAMAAARKLLARAGKKEAG